MKHRGIVAILLVTLSAFSCGKSPADRAIAELNAAIAHKGQYEETFLQAAAQLREDAALAQDDSLRWVFSRRLYGRFGSYSVDSTQHYLSLMQKYATTPEQEFRTRLAYLEFSFVRKDRMESLQEFRSLDTALIRSNESLYKAYLSTAIAIDQYLMHRDLDYLEECKTRQAIQQLRAEYIGLDTLHFNGKRMKALYEKDSGNILGALKMLEDMYGGATVPGWKASAAYNLALIYQQMQHDEEALVWFARSAQSDIMASTRGYLSLYNLSLMLSEKGRYREANKYILLNLSDAFAGGYDARFLNSAKAHMIVGDAERKEARMRMVLLGLLSLALLGIAAILYVLLVLTRRHHREMENINTRLEDTNKINSNYVFRYILQSVDYLDRCDEYRRRLLSIQKNEGGDALVRQLRSQAETYQEFRNFYRMFDQTFLDLYPDFVEKVNAMLREDSRFELQEDGGLSTELRMLAAIRLGITESGKIARFLKCSPTTVYTYRTRLHRAALCGAEEFESRIRTL